MTPKQKRFVDEYLTDLNATQAAIRAGYSPKTAAEIGAENLIKPKVQDVIARAMAERSKRTGVTQDRVVRELAKLAFVDVAELLDMSADDLFNGTDRDNTAAVASVKTKRTATDEGAVVECEVKTYDKVRALELLGKHLNMFTERREVSFQNTGQLASLLEDRRRRREASDGE